MPSFSVGSVAFVAAVVQCSTAAIAQPELHVLFTPGGQAPGLPAGVNLFTTSIPAIDAQGTVAFLSVLNGEGVTPENARALHLTSLQSSSSPLRMDQPVAGLPGVRFGELSALQSDEFGNVVLTNYLVGDGVTTANDSALFAGPMSNLTLVARMGAPAPGTTAGTLYGTLHPTLGGSYLARLRGDRVLFESRLGGTASSSNDRALFSGTVGNVSQIARRGFQAPGAPAGVLYSSFATPVINLQGKVAFSAILSGSGVTTANDLALFAGNSGALTMVAREGGAAPALPGLTTPTVTSVVSINDAGTIAFVGTLAGPGVTTENDSAAWIIPAAGPTIVIREGDPAPGLAPGIVYGNINVVVISGNDQTALLTLLAGTGVTSSNNRAIWAGIHSNLQLVARSGDPAPGMPGLALGAFFEPCLNRNGDVAFTSLVSGPGVVTANATTLWGRNRAGHNVLLGRRGVPLELAPGNSFTPDAISLSSISGSEDGKAAALNDANQVCFLLFNSATFGCAGVLADVDASCRPQITQHPQSVISSGGEVILTTTATASPGPSYQWRRGGIPLAELPPFSGTTSPTLTISSVTATEVGGYDVQVANVCGTTTSETATVSLGMACGDADFNGDGDFGTDADIEAFFLCLAGSCCPTCWHLGADFNADGDSGTDADIEAFFRVLAGNPC